jgi:Domain of unknown function (DUF4365)
VPVPDIDLPGDSDAQAIGRAGEAIASGLVNTVDLGLAYRPNGIWTDWGLDGEIEVVGGAATGALVKAQVKGTRSAAKLRTKGYHSVSVKPKTWNYWAACPLYVFVLFVDVTTRDVWWTMPSRAFATGRTAVRLSGDRCASADPQRFADAVRAAAFAPASARLLDHVDFFIDQFKDLWESKEGHDQWFSFEQHSTARLAVIYDHVDRLRVLMGIERRIFPWVWWLARSRAIASDQGFDDDGGLSLIQSVAEDAMAYLFPHYVEALGAAKKLATAPEVLEAHPQLAYLEELGLLDEDAARAYLSPYQDDPEPTMGFRITPDYGRLQRSEFQEWFAQLLDQLNVRQWGWPR